ncbi:MAG: hypothetical protein ACKO0Z_20890 [Betaproteobacteria bacterium]
MLTEKQLAALEAQLPKAELYKIAPENAWGLTARELMRDGCRTPPPADKHQADNIRNAFWREWYTVGDPYDKDSSVYYPTDSFWS